MDATVGERIKIARQAIGITQQVFADRLGLKRNTIATYEIGCTMPSDRTISDICQKFRVSEQWIRTGEGDMFVEGTQREKLESFFADVLATAPDERSAFVAALDDLPPEFWEMVADFARSYTEKLKKED